ncbi:MAG: YtxH domain-containing protein [Gemmatimonadales bacterium]
MRTNIDNFDLESADGEEAPPRGGLLGLALMALAVGAGTALLFAPAEGAKTREVVGGRLRDFRGEAEGALSRVQGELGRREARRRRERRSSALLGLAVGAGVAALLLPQSGSETRRKLSEAWQRRKGDVDEEVDRVVREPQPDPQPTS